MIVDCRFLSFLIVHRWPKVLRQLDIATSQTIAIEVVSGLGKVADDHTSVSLWALGDQMVIRVWQKKVNACYAWDPPASCLHVIEDYYKQKEN